MEISGLIDYEKYAIKLRIYDSGLKELNKQSEIPKPKSPIRNPIIAAKYD
jgi:hypothetical protein